MKIARSLSFCQKTIVFPTTCVLTPQNTSRPKVSMRKLSPSGRKGKARQACLSRPKGAVSCRILPSAKQAGQAHRSAPHKILCKSPALPDFYTSARDALRPVIERDALAWAVGIVDNDEIDHINILQASFLAMHRAVDGLSVRPDFLLIDGNRFRPYDGICHQCIVKGDGKMMSIAAASILAKTHRDEFMKRIHEEFPQYGWNVNKGYPTKAHREAIARFGATPYHRHTFRLLAEPSLFPEL